MRKLVASALQPFQYTVWNEFSPLALKHKAVNLGQGFPSFEPPLFVKEALSRAVMQPLNQYSRSQGYQPLVEQIARVNAAKFARQIDPLTEVVVTMGASEALLCSMLGILNRGDEVVLFDPYFDIYLPQISLAGAVPVFVPLVPPGKGGNEWHVDFDRLEKAFSPRTKIFLINSPLNPLGKVYSHEELTRIASILHKWPDVHIVSDEVYEHITFGKTTMKSIANYGLWERTVTLSSAGKMFSVTGWKTGWAVGGAEVVRKLAIAHQWTIFCSNTPCQAAVAEALQAADRPYEDCANYYVWLQREYERKLQRICGIMKTSQTVKLRPLIPDGGFFVMAEVDTSHVSAKYLEGATPDFAFCRWLTVEHGVTAIPGSAFFSDANKHLATNLARFALCKRHEEYDQVERLLA